MLTAKEKSALLNQVVDLLEQADALQQKALGPSDVCEDNACRIQDLIDDIVSDIVMFDSEAV
jgi:DNA-binding ferritin-like protein (Dps family)